MSRDYYPEYLTNDTFALVGVLNEIRDVLDRIANALEGDE